MNWKVLRLEEFVDEDAVFATVKEALEYIYVRQGVNTTIKVPY